MTNKGKVDAILSIAMGKDVQTMRKPMVYMNGKVTRWYEPCDDAHAMYVVYGDADNEQYKVMESNARAIAQQYWSHPFVLGVKSMVEVDLLLKVASV